MTVKDESNDESSFVTWFGFVLLIVMVASDVRQTVFLKD